MISSISVSDFIKSGLKENIIDIRSVQSFNNNHIPGAKNIAFEKLLASPEKYLDRHKIYYIYCQKGVKSITICKRLNILGYRIVNINGGYESWILEK